MNGNLTRDRRDPGPVFGLDSAWLEERLAALTGGEPASRWLVAFSGGIDSAVLLHALRHAPAIDPQKIVAMHIDHGLHPDSADWAVHCRQFAERQGIASFSCKVQVDEHSGLGLEAAAREARYAGIRAEMRQGDCVLSAHHEDDQAETLLLNLMRGSGAAGLAGIGAAQRFGSGRLLRPLLGIHGEAIAEYAKRHKLVWIDDPGNEDLRFDRNFLRREVMPKLATRWPAVSARLGQSAALASEGSDLLRDLADIDIAAAGSAARLDIGVVRELSPARQRNLLRRAVSLCGLPPPPATRLYQAVDELLPAREDAQPLVCWQGGELRRYRDRLYVMAPLPAPPVAPEQVLRPDAPLELGPGMGDLRLVPHCDGGIDSGLASAGLTVRFRHGGEEIRPAGRDCTHKLKKLLQQEGIVPWMRARLPLLYAGDDLVAVADLWIADYCSRRSGFGVSWKHRPPLD